MDRSLNRENLKQVLAANLQVNMAKHNWNQSDLAREAKMGRDNISLYVRGRSLPNHDHIERLANAFGIALDELVPGYQAAADNGDRARLHITEGSTPGYVCLRLKQEVNLLQLTRILQILEAGSVGSDSDSNKKWASIDESEGCENTCRA